MHDPDPAVTAKDPLLRPLTIGHVQFRNRIMSTSHASGLEVGGMPEEAYQRYHEEKARGGIGLSMFGGSSNVDRELAEHICQLNVATDAIIPHLQRFSERMHARGAALMCQITHLGRRGDPYAGDRLPTIAPSPIRETLHRSIPKEMDEHDIDRVVKAYAAAARRCREGGLDGIETLAAGHLIGQFLSPVTNRRTDRFGGTLENRCRFALMVHEAIRKSVGDRFLVGMRFVVDEGPDGGLNSEDCLRAPHPEEGGRSRLLQCNLRNDGHDPSACGREHAGDGFSACTLGRGGRRVPTRDPAARLPCRAHR